MQRFNTILIANRGEIAVRVIHTAQRMGYQTVAVYSQADAHALHVTSADQAIAIGGISAQQSYLDIDKIIDAAKCSGADAIHPGYGFLSENPEFAQRCASEGIVFIGPSAQSIRLMGSKRLSKEAMLKHQVPCIPGYQGDDQDLLSKAQQIGVPLMLKASAGGGGRGMRLLDTLDNFASELSLAKAEALAAFGNDEIILERALIEPRHIEIQIFADEHGNTVHLGERDCSIQRRHQKVVEESPSPFISPALRETLGQTAITVAKACDYVGAGTVEFLVDAQQNFFFLEMNTRLQVEHPVTELVTGLDLVSWQLRVADGQTLPLSQEQVRLQGHAIEVRLYAEDPRHDFMPQTGQVRLWQTATHEAARTDSGIATGQVISPHYDPMLAKLIAYGETREQAIALLSQTLTDTVLLGVHHNLHFLHEVINQSGFKAGQATTAFLSEVYPKQSYQTPQTPALTVALAALLIYRQTQLAPQFAEYRRNPWRTHVLPISYISLNDGEQDYRVAVSAEGEHYVVNVDEHSFNISASAQQTAHRCEYRLDGLQGVVHYAHQRQQIYLQHQLAHYHFTDTSYQAAATSVSAGDGQITAQMDGALVEIKVELGEQVSAGQTVVVIEAMKMAHQLCADVDGTVSSIHVEVNQQIKAGQTLVSIEADQ